LSGDYGTCLDLFGGACGATATDCPDALPVHMPGTTCDGTSTDTCDLEGVFEFDAGVGTCAGPACLPFIACIQSYSGGPGGVDITCTNSGVLSGECP
jgi:hypothetical protein